MTSTPLFQPQIDVEASAQLVSWARSTLDQSTDSFTAYRTLATRLGAHVYNREDNLVAFGFWLPDLTHDQALHDQVYLELLRPLSSINLQVDQSQIQCKRVLLPVEVIENDLIWVVIRGLNVGQRTQIGDLYQIRYKLSLIHI